MESMETQQNVEPDAVTSAEPQEQCAAGMMLCPVCGHEMPDLKGGKATICPAWGFKDSCCY